MIDKDGLPFIPAWPTSGLSGPLSDGRGFGGPRPSGALSWLIGIIISAVLVDLLFFPGRFTMHRKMVESVAGAAAAKVAGVA